MDKFKETVIDFAYACAEQALHSKNSDDMRERLAPIIEAYEEDLVKHALDAVIVDTTKRPTMAVEKSDLWLRVLTDYNAGMSASDIAKRYHNPSTGKSYTRGYVYWVINRLKSPEMQEAIKNLKQR